MELFMETSLAVTSILVEENSTTFCYEGNVGKYGKVFGNHTLVANDPSRSAGQLSGHGQTILPDGTMISVSVTGLWRREGAKFLLFNLDALSNGDQNYVEISVDLNSKEAAVKAFTLN